MLNYFGITLRLCVPGLVKDAYLNGKKVPTHAKKFLIFLLGLDYTFNSPFTLGLNNNYVCLKTIANWNLTSADVLGHLSLNGLSSFDSVVTGNSQSATKNIAFKRFLRCEFFPRYCHSLSCIVSFIRTLSLYL